MLLELEQSQLVLVDFQTRLMPAIHDGARVQATAVRLARIARLQGVSVLNLNDLSRALQPVVGPGEEAVLAEALREDCRDTP